MYAVYYHISVNLFLTAPDKQVININRYYNVMPDGPFDACKQNTNCGMSNILRKICKIRGINFGGNKPNIIKLLILACFRRKLLEMRCKHH